MTRARIGVHSFVPRILIAVAVACLGIALTGCNTIPQGALLDPEAPPVRYSVSHDPSTVREEAEFTAADGAVLGYITHRRVDRRARTAIVYLHGIESHAGWFDRAGDGLAARGYDVLCLDRRGSGINRENRGFASGHIDSFHTLFSDISAFVASIRDGYDTVIVTGLSWGGKLAIGWALSDPDACDGLVLITPGIRSLVEMDLLESVGILKSAMLNQKQYFRTPIEVTMFTRDPEVLEKIEADPLRLRYATGKFYVQSVSLDGYVNRHMTNNRLPILLFLAGQDRIINNPAVVRVLDTGVQETFEVITYEDQIHSIQFDATDRLVEDMTAWIQGQGGQATRGHAGSRSVASARRIVVAE